MDKFLRNATKVFIVLILLSIVLSLLILVYIFIVDITSLPY